MSDDQDIARAEALATWLREQPIAPRTRTALLRDLDLVTGERTAEGEEAQLRGLDPEAFLAQLHTSDGGLVAGVAGLGARGLAALREVFPSSTPAEPKRRRRARTAAPAPAAQAEQATPPAPPTVSTPAAPSVTTEAELLSQWRRLHPQGRRAALGFIAELLAQDVAG